jgi:hypothetical protein
MLDIEDGEEKNKLDEVPDYRTPQEKEIAKIITNKNASIKYLENIINKASKEQKPFVSQAVTDLKQLDKFSGKAAANTLDFGIDDPNAEEPVLMQGINTEQEVQKIKQQFYKE